MTTYGTPRAIDPIQGLREELHRSAGIVAWLEEQVGGLGENEVTHMTVVFEADGKPATYGEHTNEIVKLYQQERKHFLDVCKTCVGVGIAERELRIAEEQAKIFNHTLRAILTDAGVDVTKPEVLTIVRKHLSAAAVLAAA